MSNIAIYGRKSKYTNRGESIENQIIKCKKFIEFKLETDPNEAIIFTDEDFSGRNENRPEFQKMIQLVKAGKIKHIIVYQLNRFGRNAKDIHNSMAMCSEHGCIMYSATEGFDTATNFGRAVMGILASLAQLETEQLGERIKDNLHTLARKGRWLGGQEPLGFDGTREYYIDPTGKERSVTKLKANEKELKIVKQIYQKYLEKKSLSQVHFWATTNYLKGKNGADICKSGIGNILRNPVYAKSSPEILKYLSERNYEVCGEPNGNGILRYGKTIATVGKHKGIIESKDWLAVQKILEKNNEKAPRLNKTNRALFSGKLKCACGASMHIIYGPVSKVTGKRIPYYCCSLKINSHGQRCSSKNINVEKFDKAFVEFLKTYSKETLIEQLKIQLKEAKKTESRINVDEIDATIEKSNKAIQKLLSKLKLTDDNDISLIIFEEIKKEKEKIKELTSQKANATSDKFEIKMTEKELTSIWNSLDNFLNLFDTLEYEAKKNALSELVSAIYFDGEKMLVDFNLETEGDFTDFLLNKSSNEKKSHFRPTNTSTLDKNAIFDIPDDTFDYEIAGKHVFVGPTVINKDSTMAERFLAARIKAKLTPLQLHEKSGVSCHCFRDIELGVRDSIHITNLKKLLKVLDEEILLDEYLRFILYKQEDCFKKLLGKYDESELSGKFKCKTSTIRSWACGRYRIKRSTFEILKKEYPNFE